MKTMMQYLEEKQDEYKLRPPGVECKPYDPQAEIVTLHRLVHDLQLRVSTLERRAYAEPIAPVWPTYLPQPCTWTCGTPAYTPASSGPPHV